MNDYLIPSKSKEHEKIHRGRHAKIEYQIEKKGYYIKDLGVGFGAYLKVD